MSPSLLHSFFYGNFVISALLKNIIVLVFTGGRRPSPFNRRPTIAASDNNENNSEIDNDAENNDEEVSTESQPAFIPTPAIKVGVVIWDHSKAMADKLMYTP